jgi:hypothetical protein
MFIERNARDTPGSYHSYVRQSVFRRVRHLIARQDSTNRYLDEIFAAPRYLFTSDDKHDRCMAVGFKLMFNQACQSPAALRYIETRRISVIHLIRINPLRVLVSRAVNRIFDVPHTSVAIETPKVTLDPGVLLRSLERIEYINREWERRTEAGPYLKVYYEDLINHRPRELNRVTDFLGIPRSPSLEPPTVKLNPASLADLVDNYDEIAALLKETRFEGYLES